MSGSIKSSAGLNSIILAVLCICSTTVFIQNVTASLCFRADCVEVVWFEGWSAWPGCAHPPRAAVTGCWSAWCCRGCNLDEDTRCNETTEWSGWPSSSPWRCVCPHRNEARSRRVGRNGWAPAKQRRWRLSWTGVCLFVCLFVLLHDLLFCQSSSGWTLWVWRRTQSYALGQCLEWCWFLSWF